MNISFFSNGKSGGSGPINYILGMKDHAGVERLEKPEVLMGDPELTKNLIDSITRQEKYTSLSINFTRGENPTREQKLEIINAFKDTFFAGLKENQFNLVAVAHDDHIHIVTPKMELTTRKQLNIKPPGKMTDDLLKSFQIVMNENYGWRQIVEDPLKTMLNKYEIMGKDDNAKFRTEAKNRINSTIVSKVRDKSIKNRGDLICFLNDKKVDIARISDLSITIRTKTGRKFRLEGPLFRKDADYSELVRQSDVSKRSMGKISSAELVEAKLCVQRIFEKRVSFNSERYKKKLGKVQYVKTRFANQLRQPKIAIGKKAPLKGTPLSGVGGGESVFKSPNVINIREHIEKRVTSLQKTPQIKAKVIQFARLGKDSIKPLKPNFSSSAPVHATGGTQALKLIAGQMESDLYALQMQFGSEKNPENAAALAKLIAAKKMEMMRMNQQILEAEKRDQVKFKF